MDIAIETVVEIIFWLIMVGVLALITRSSLVIKRKNDLYLIKDLSKYENRHD